MAEEILTQVIKRYWLVRPSWRPRVPKQHVSGDVAHLLLMARYVWLEMAIVMLSSYPGYFREPRWISTGLPEIQGNMKALPLVYITCTVYPIALQWRYNDLDGVSNHKPHDCLLNRLFRRRSKKISKLRVTGLCAGNSPVTGEFPAQRASNAENFSIWWRHRGIWKPLCCAARLQYIQCVSNGDTAVLH